MKVISVCRYLKTRGCLITLFFCSLSAFNTMAQGKQQKALLPISQVKGHLVYAPDSQGNRVPDFSYCGYKASEEIIPDVEVKVVVPVVNGDATTRIQSAVDYVAGLPLDKHGFRGTVLLEKGNYTINGQIKISASGIVLRGNGMNGGTTLTASGNDRQTLIRITGINDKKTSPEEKISDLYVPVNSVTLNINNNGLEVGDKVVVHRPSTMNWIKILGAETFGGDISALGWKPGERDIYWDRTVTAVKGNSVTIDVPITTALDTTYGGASVAVYKWPGIIRNIGIENLSCVSTYNEANPKDEAHRWMAITMENVEDAWVRQLRFEHFAGSAVDILETAKRVTVEDCESLSPVSEIGGERRYTYFTTGQQTLIQRCYAENGWHDFAVGFCAPGPNAFVQCQSVQPHSFSGTIDSWASGVLFDIVNVDGNALRFGNRGQDGQGAGWSAANSVFWQCTAARVDCYKPPTANNWAFATWAQFSGDGYWGESNATIQPRSLYYAQLADRLGKNVSDRAQLLFVETNASSSPSAEVAAELIAASVKPAITLREWIDDAHKRQPLSVNSNGARSVDEIGLKKAFAIKQADPLHIQNGWLLRGKEVVTGSRQEVQWWNGGVMPTDLPKMKIHITRFVPGRTGTGLTDDLDEMTDHMKAIHMVAIEHNYALWYERRRDDHERIRRMDGDVWPPFYELPFARTGISSGWDGMSKYDLTKYNIWYWSRLKQFANLADQKGLVLVHQNYFQHNIIEAGAHYVDFPWRPVNNINNTGFPEPVPFAGDKRVFMAEQFYDENNAVRRPIHEAYIRQCLDNFKDNNGVIQLIGAEFTGPRHFVAFWLDVINNWEKGTGHKELIGLSTTKDVQDSILSDQARSAVVDVIDIRQWYYESDGKTYEPKGGQNLAPRQHERLLKPKVSSFEQVYRAVKEYRLKYPDKAVMYSREGYEQFGWAAFMGGGSMANIPVVSEGFLTDASSMQPVEKTQNGEYVLSGKTGTIIYSTTTFSLDLLNSPGSAKVTWINARDGKEMKTEVVEGGKKVVLNNPAKGAAILWLHK